MFICTAGVEVFNIVTLAQGSTAKLAQLKSLSTGVVIPVTSETIWDNVVIWATGIVGALIFMWGVRRDKDS